MEKGGKTYSRFIPKCILQYPIIFDTRINSSVLLVRSSDHSKDNLWKANSCRRGHGEGKGMCNFGSWTSLASPWTKRSVLYQIREGRTVCLINIHFTMPCYSEPSPSLPQINFIVKSHVLHYSPSAHLLFRLHLLYLLLSSVTDFYGLCIAFSKAIIIFHPRF